MVKLLSENDGYELVLTGHSLGAGTAALLNILLHQDKSTIDYRNVRCFAFACPPVFAPLDAAPPGCIQSTINYIHGRDCVPFLSLYSCRRFFSCVQAVEEYRYSKMTRLERARVLWGLSPPPDELVAAVRQASSGQLAPRVGAPTLVVPARTSIWMQEDLETGIFSYRLCDPEVLSHMGVQVDLNMIPDHFPSRYENSFQEILGEYE